MRRLRKSPHVVQWLVVFFAVSLVVFGQPTADAADYFTDIKSAMRPGLVAQTTNPITDTSWSDVTATTTDDTSARRMFYSNNPESIPWVGSSVYAEGIIYNSAFRSNGGRVFMHHANNSQIWNMKVQLIAKNVGSATGTVTIGRFGDGSGASAYDYVALGGESVRQFFTNAPLNWAYTMPVGGYAVLADKSLAPNQAVSINMDLTYSGTFRLFVVYTTDGSTWSNPLTFLQNKELAVGAYPPADVNPDFGRGDAVHSRTTTATYNPDSGSLKRLRINCCAPGQTHPNDTMITAQDYTGNYSTPTARAINANFGLLYQLRHNTGTWTGTTNHLFVGLNSRGGSFQGGFWASEDIPTLSAGYKIPLMPAQTSSGVLGRWGSSWRTVSIDYILPGGMNGPNVVVYTGFQP